MYPRGHLAIGRRHLRDLREEGFFPVRGARLRLQLLRALLHRGTFLGRESLRLLLGRAGALDGLLCSFFRTHRFLLSWADEAPCRDHSSGGPFVVSRSAERAAPQAPKL